MSRAWNPTVLGEKLPAREAGALRPITPRHVLRPNQLYPSHCVGRQPWSIKLLTLYGAQIKETQTRNYPNILSKLEIMRPPQGLAISHMRSQT